LSRCSLPRAEEAVGALVFYRSTLHFLQLLVAEDTLQITEAQISGVLGNCCQKPCS